MEDPGVRYFTVDLHHDLIVFVVDDAVCETEREIVGYQYVNKCVVCAVVLPRNPKAFINSAS